MAAPNAPAGAYYAVPVTSTILLYEKGQGYPTFDAAQAKEYFRKVNDRVAELVLDTIAKWDLAGGVQDSQGQAARSRKTRRSMTFVPVGPVTIRFPVCLKKP